MNFLRKRSSPSVKLPTTLAIGFTGHRQLADEAKCRAAIRKVLEDWRTRVSGIVYGVSSVAAGGDLLFAETCLELDLPVRVLLPFPKEQFRNDFDDATWERAERVLASALFVEVTGASEESDERYYECGIETVQQSELLIALWDGEPSRGMGGTADIVHFAKERGQPVVWINSETSTVQYFNEDPELLRDAEMDFLHGLPDPSTELPTSNPLSLARVWFTKLDDNASRVAPQFRRLAAIPIFCTAIAALLSGMASFAPGHRFWLLMGTILGVMAGGLPVVMKLERRQVAWTKVRTAAEVCRSCLAIWQTPTLYEVVGPETVPELAGMLRSLNFLKMSDRTWRQTMLEDFKGLYRRDRVQNQIEYFSRHAALSAEEVRRYQIIIWASVILCASFNLWGLGGPRVWSGLSWGHWKPELAFVATIFFQTATVAGALLVVNDHQRRRQHYRELHRMLTQWDKQLELAQTWTIVLRIISMVEKALLAELIEWRSLIRHRKVPQK